MIVSWMFYSIATTLLLGGAAVAAEHCLRLFGRPARWVWVVAFVSSLSLPLIAMAVPGVLPTLQTVSQPGDAGVELAETVWNFPGRVVASAETHLATVETTAFITWIAASITLLSVLGWSFMRLRGEVRSCTPSWVNGIPVLVSSSLGPAVVGLVRQAIVLPAWVFRCDDGTQTLIARHEQEHVRARDQYLLVVASFLVLLVPWNVVLWWYSARLRVAVEADCDLRLLRGGASLRDYGRLLLEVGSRLGRAPLTALAFSRNRSSLIRRVQLMTFTPRMRAAQTAAAAVAAVALILLACEMPVPTENTEGSLPTMAVTGSDEPESEPVKVRVRTEDDEPTDVTLEPLVYADGVRLDGKVRQLVDSLPRDRIDRIEVIKGDAARAQYGEDAANGVIHIYLKTVVRGEGNESPED